MVSFSAFPAHQRLVVVIVYLIYQDREFLQLEQRKLLPISQNGVISSYREKSFQVQPKFSRRDIGEGR